MSSRRAGTSSKRKRTTPQKLKSRKLFAVSGNDLLEPPSISRAIDDQDGFPETLHNRENVPKSYSQSLTKKESLSETPQNKENMPGSAQRGRGRPKGSKNKTFPVSPTRVYSVREGRPAYSPPKNDGEQQENGVSTPHRGRGRPKGSFKVKPIGEFVPKKSRGRPKGSKNRKPTKSALMKLSPGPSKPGRGRPRKILTIDGETPKREKRGRPKGSLNKVPSAKKKLSPGPSKRGRGRPRKILVTSDGETPKQEKRGRPKGSLNKVPSAKKLAPLSGTHEIKKRGRPKKIHLHPVPINPLTPKRPRGRPKSTGISAPLPIIEAKESEDEETHNDKEEDYGEKMDETDDGDSDE